MGNDDSETQPKPPSDVPLAPPADVYLGTTIADRYRVLGKLGQGGMGVVYLAEHVLIEKKVAIKILSQDFARKPELVARFMQEARAASRIGHENIVDITDFGETAAGSVFFAMEFLDGTDLSGLIRAGGAMPFVRARFIMAQICRALAAAHDKGIIHRDLKPENVYLITREGRADFVKVLDFGIAKMSALDENSTPLTRTGMIFGTPEYMSPEQARGDKPDHRVDIYAAGCILYEMLTGTVPFAAETFMGVLTQHMLDAPEPPSQRNPRADLPAGAEAVVLRALAKDREQRFQSMAELAQALAACPTTGPTRREASGPVRPSPRRPSGKTAATPRSRAGIAVGALTLVLAAIGLGGYWTTRGQPPATNAPATATANAPAARNASAATSGPAATSAPAATNAPAATTTNAPAATTTSAPAATTGAPTTTTAAPPRPAPPARFTMTIHTQPTGVQVFQGAALVGTTPCDLPLPAATTAVELTLKKKGWRDQPLKVVPDRDRQFVADLVPLLRPHAAAPRPPAEPAVEPPPPPVAPPPKANDKLRDLKDPFAN